MNHPPPSVDECDNCKVALAEAEKYTRQYEQQKKQFEEKLSSIKAQHSQRIKNIMDRHQDEKSVWKKMLSQQAVQNKEDLLQKLKHLKKTYQFQMEEVRSAFQNQNVSMVNELRTSLGAQIQEGKEANTKLVESYGAKIEKLQTLLQDEILEPLAENKKEVERPDESEAIKNDFEKKLIALVSELEKREQEIQKLNKHSHQLEKTLAERYAYSIWARTRGLEGEQEKESQVNKKPKKDRSVNLPDKDIDTIESNKKSKIDKDTSDPWQELARELGDENFKLRSGKKNLDSNSDLLL